METSVDNPLVLRCQDDPGDSLRARLKEDGTVVIEVKAQGTRHVVLDCDDVLALRRWLKEATYRICLNLGPP